MTGERGGKGDHTDQLCPPTSEPWRRHCIQWPAFWHACHSTNIDWLNWFLVIRTFWLDIITEIVATRRVSRAQKMPRTLMLLRPRGSAQYLSGELTALFKILVPTGFAAGEKRKRKGGERAKTPESWPVTCCAPATYEVWLCQWYMQR